MPNKLTDLEIKKALECCGRNSIAGWLNECKNCPLNDRTTCIPELMYKAKDLINRQEEENESLKAEKENLVIDLTNAMAKIAGLEKQTEWFTNIGKLYSEIKTEAYKECIEKVKEKSKKTEVVASGALIAISYAISAKNLDNLLNELVGDGDGK